MRDDSDPILVFVPPLISVFVRAEGLKGTPLTEAEVLKLRDESHCEWMDPATVRVLEAERGYPDLDPENCWTAWQHLREKWGLS